MNKAYRLIWSRVKEAWLVVAEKVRSTGGGVPVTVSLLAALVLAAGSVSALPACPQVVSGTVGIATAGTTMTITNSPSAIINWQGFSIAANETTRFVQQSANSSVLNRVIGGNSSQIYGMLQSNGRVFLINQNGILFGPNAKIDVNGLVASSLNITNQDFLAGRLKFGADALAGKVENQGVITTPSGGSVYLIAPDVENSGVINVPNGDVLLAAGKEVLLVDSDAPEIAVVITAPEGQALNLGSLTADAGRIGLYGSIVRQKGVVSADSAVSEGGKIFLRASRQATLEQGSVTTATGTKGGTVQVLGQHVGLLDDAVVDVSGAHGGGTVLVGGDYQGRSLSGAGGEIIPNAEIAYMGKDAVIKADATDTGNGGRVILWADATTRAYGSISAQGGANGGDGGFVETSGKVSLDANNIRVSTAAPAGLSGTWLLDPSDILITAGGMDNFTSGGPPWFFDPLTSIGSISWSTIETGLSSGNVTVQTTSGTGGFGDIIADDGYNFANAGAGVLTLHADRDIVLNRTSLDLTGNPQGLTLLAGRNVSINNGIDLAVVTISAATGSISYNNSVTPLSSPSITLNAATGIYGSSTSDPFRINYSGGAATLTVHNTGAGPIRILDGSYGGLQLAAVSQGTAGQVISVGTAGGMTPLLSVTGAVSAPGSQIKLSGGSLTISAGGSVAGDDLLLEATGGGGITLSGGSVGDASTRRIEFTADAISGTGTSVSVSGSSVQNEILYRPYTVSNTINTALVPYSLWSAPTLVFGDDSMITGNITAGPVNWTGGIKQRVAFLTQGSVSGGNIAAQGLGVIAGGSINLSGNTVSYIAMRSGSGGVTFSNTAGFNVTSAVGGITSPTTISGVSSNGAAISLSAAAGDITVTSPVNAGSGQVDITASSGGIYTGSGGAINIIGGSFNGSAGTNIGGPTYSLMTQTPTWNSVYAGGDLYLDNTGAVTTAGTVDAGGIVKLTAHSPLTIGTSGVLAGGDIVLEASAMGGLDDLTINGEVISSAGNIYLRAGNLIYENALVSAPMGTVTRTPNLNSATTPEISQTVVSNLINQVVNDTVNIGPATTTPEGLILIADVSEESAGGATDSSASSEDEKEKKAKDTEGQKQTGGGKKDGKPKKNYCN